MGKKLKAPFPYFGGKSSISSLVWDRLGDVDNYIEPFCGSAVLLLARPYPPRIETINDMDCYVANFWRATAMQEQREDLADLMVAEYADWPVNECDLHARHRWLVGVPSSPWTNTPYLHAMAGPDRLEADRREFRRRMRTDPNYFCARTAGWWCWGLCCWIGSGWCGDPEGHPTGRPLGGSGEKVPRERGGFGSLPGVHAKGPAGGSGDSLRRNEGATPALAGSHGKGQGVVRNGPAGGSGERRPQLGAAYSLGSGVIAGPTLGQRLPDIGGIDGLTGKGVNVGVWGTCAQRRAWLLDWFSRLRDRLRCVRVCCGDWSRVCSSESVTTRLGVTGVFLDPPYGTLAGRDSKIYSVDSLTVASDVRDWCLANGTNKQMRIALCGYMREGHEALEQHGWQIVKWKASGGYGNRSAKGKANARKERIWFSPHCKNERTLFDALE